MPESFEQPFSPFLNLWTLKDFIIFELGKFPTHESFDHLKFKIAFLSHFDHLKLTQQFYGNSEILISYAYLPDSCFKRYYFA